MTDRSVFPDRIGRLREQFRTRSVDAFLITFLPHLRYMSGFSGSNGIGIVTMKDAFLVTDGRYAEQVREETRGWKISITQSSLVEKIDRKHFLKPGMRVGLDGNSMLLSQFKALKRQFPAVRFLPRADTIEQLAAVKDEAEIDAIRRAVAITDQTFTDVLPLIRPGITELDIAAEISYRQRKRGAEADAFETIVASGPRSALPHGRASRKIIRRGEALTLDFGCIVDGYHSDMTRTVFVGKPKPEMRKVYQVVLEAQTRAIDHATSGLKANELDSVARNVIRKHGYDKMFRHSLGHGIGLQIHEPPRISMLGTMPLAKGNVITIEPGVYLPNVGGVRIEDDIVILPTGCEVLNASPKELLIV